MVVLVIDWVYLKETLPTSWLKAVNLCDTELSYELEADQLVAASRHWCLFSVQNDGVALTFCDSIPNPYFEITCKFAELTELFNLAMDLTLPGLHDVLHQAILLEHRHLGITWSINIQLMQQQLDQLLVVLINGVP